MESFNSGGDLLQVRRYFHFDSTTTRYELRVNEDVFSDCKTIMEISFHFVEDILGGTSKKDGASFRLLTFSQESEVFITNEFNFEKTAFRADIRFLDFLRSVDNSCTGDSGDSVVISFSDSSNDRDVLLDQVVDS